MRDFILFIIFSDLLIHIHANSPITENGITVLRWVEKILKNGLLACIRITHSRNEFHDYNHS